MSVHIPTGTTAILIVVEGVRDPYYVKHHEDSGYFLEMGTNDIGIQDHYVEEVMKWIGNSKEDFFLYSFRIDPCEMKVYKMPLVMKTDPSPQVF